MTNADTSVDADLPPRQSSYSYEELIRSSEGELFGMSNGKLPKPPMLMTDRITLITSDTGAYRNEAIQRHASCRHEYRRRRCRAWR